MRHSRHDQLDAVLGQELGECGLRLREILAAQDVGAETREVARRGGVVEFE